MISSPGMGGEAVEDDRPLRGFRKQLGVHLKRSQIGTASLRLVLVAHAHPDVGVDRVGAGGGLARVARVQRRQAGLDPIARRETRP